MNSTDTAAPSNDASSSTSSARATVFQPLPQKALRRNLVAALLRAIFKGQLGAGDWLNAQKLAAQFGVSATPVREALLELLSVGVVQMEHNRGTVVRPFGPSQLLDIYHVRRVLEAEATRCACGRIPADRLEALRFEMTALIEDRAKPDWSDRAMDADRQLHGLIAERCGNQRLAEEIGRYNTLVQCIRDVVGNQKYAQSRALPEHLEIIEALSHHDPQRASQAMENHIQSTADAVRQALFPSTRAEETNP